MPRPSIALVVLLTVLAGCATRVTRHSSILNASAQSIVRLVIWNSTDQTPEISVSLDKEMIYTAVIGITMMDPSIVAQREYKILPGIHRVVIHDQTRGIRREAELKLEDVANVHVVVKPDDTALFITFDKNPGYQ